ncbi:MAG: MiaB/RimO family radical SAM methylthiotransferase [Gemmatimonadetes bacterium]|nr:MiaB/RimO family radical SAM methylthiotransferase [Gemmatimonadota bacterium]
MRDVGEELLGRTRAFVKIQEGCDRACAYCVVPGVRGRQWSVPESEVVEEVGRLARGGCPEVVLTGTRPGSYGFDIAGASLAGLLERILADTGVGRVRVSSLEPGEIAGGLLDLWAGPGKGRLCPHFHLPLQSGSDAVLRRMGRRYTAGQFAGEVARIRGALPEAAVTTDVMAGFPGETEEDHRATLALMVGIRFSGAHVFPYSRRPGTPAARLGGHVRAETKARRAAEIRALAEHRAREFRLRFVGSVRQVLWEGRDRRTGLTDNYLRVRRAGRTPGQAGPDAPEWSGVIEDVELVALDGRDLVGRGRSCAGGGAGARSGQPVP